MKTEQKQRCAGTADLELGDLTERISCTHTVRCLNKAGIRTVAELEQLSMAEMRAIRGIGKVIAASLEEEFTFADQRPTAE